MNQLKTQLIGQSGEKIKNVMDLLDIIKCLKTNMMFDKSYFLFNINLKYKN